MLTNSDQRELHQIERELRDADRGFVWRPALLQGVLRWAGPGRRAYLPVLAVLAAGLLGLVAAAGRLLMAFAEGGMFLGPAALMVLRDTAWPGGESEQKPGHSDSRVRDRPRPDGTDLR